MSENGHKRYSVDEIWDGKNVPNCMSCIHYQSFREMYDGDEFEPEYQGRCRHPSNGDVSAGDFNVCHLFEQLPMKNATEADEP